jgi:uncharacterized protein YbjT (DUF2867 family)
MVGQGVLRECLLDPDVEHILSVVRAPGGERHEKLRELVHLDFLDWSAAESELAGFDACFFCLGVSSVGMPPDRYRMVTYEFTLAVAHALLARSPGVTFIYVSGMGTDGTGSGPTRWARVKGETENALLRLPFKAAYMLRPAFIQPMHGIRSKTTLYRVVYAMSGPLMPLLRSIAPNYVTTTEQMGRAMLSLVKTGFARRVLENADINRVPPPGPTH